jgi:NAD(P)-dependent dehydrogenase (short-subunit alcohol dehydrogenase family)
MSLFTLKGKKALVPGGYGGIGEAVSQGLCAAGAHVVVAGRSPAKAAALAGRLATTGHTAHGIALDAEDVASIQRGVDQAASLLGGLDILVNCIGKNREQRLGEVTPETFDEIYRTNLRSAMFLAQAAARHQGRGGKQVHLLSVRSQLGMRGYGYSAYCATKGALVMLIKQHAVELCAHGICVNGVAPTVVRGEMARHWLDNPQTREHIFKRIPLGRVAEPQDVVGATQFFCSPAAAFITGQVIYVDGGLTATQ